MPSHSPIPTQEENPTGLHQRYVVQKADGTPTDRNAVYFVLRLDGGGSDPEHIHACRKAAFTYAAAARHIPHLAELALDLEAMLSACHDEDEAVAAGYVRLKPNFYRHVVCKACDGERSLGVFFMEKDRAFKNGKFESVCSNCGKNAGNEVKDYPYGGELWPWKTMEDIRLKKFKEKGGAILLLTIDKHGNRHIYDAHYSDGTASPDAEWPAHQDGWYYAGRQTGVYELVPGRPMAWTEQPKLPVFTHPNMPTHLVMGTAHPLSAKTAAKVDFGEKACPIPASEHSQVQPGKMPHADYETATDEPPKE